ncbi:LytTR family transcriptional regulator [Melghirimyces profundicolus]|uniref:LytTR family transcriptional regulator n=1 Tax=Melghirimyces profundicolus TaxID=1242148 RepID=A0A2T6AY30_9BACL|nr:LytTR family DNA-binding domain-containing protein [Melghirimyces profundicolus]PTX48718.1 LytTR family transcriptional regulator [Melghirimyces profundicolus]
MNSSLLSLVTGLLKDWVPSEASLAVARESKYILYQAGQYDLSIQAGQTVPRGSVSDLVFRYKKQVDRCVDHSVFGIPYHGMGYPLETRDGFMGVLTVILPPNKRTGSPLEFVTGFRENIWKPVPVEEIAYFESSQKKTWFTSTSEPFGTFSTAYTLQSLEQKLPARFLRIHRSYIINIGYIEKIYRDVSSRLLIKLATPDGCVLPVGNSYLKNTRRILGF